EEKASAAWAAKDICNPRCRALSTSRPRRGLLLRRRDGIDELADQIVRRHALGVGVESCHEPVAKDGEGDFTDIVGRDVQPAMQNRLGLAAEVQVLARPRAGPPGCGGR